MGYSNLEGGLTCAMEALVSRTLLLVVSGAPAAPFVSCSALLMMMAGRKDNGLSALCCVISIKKGNSRLTSSGFLA